MKAKRTIVIARKQDPRILEIFTHFGLKAQVKKTLEELWELAWAIIVWRFMTMIGKNTDKHLAHVHEEMADVRIMIDQLEVGTFGRNRCEQIRSEKLERTIKRIQFKEQK